MAPDFRTSLQQELLKRCRSKPRYSLRAFATYLRISPSELSKILRGTRAISPKMFETLADRLALDPTERTRLAPAFSRRSPPDTKASGATAAPEYQQLSLDLFQVISDWYHYALLELTHIKGFDSTPKSAARALGITVSEVNIAVERLERLGMLKITKTGRWPNGRWMDESGAVTAIQNEFTNVALRKLQKQILAQAEKAIDEIPIARRDQTSMTMAIDTKLLPEAKKRVAKFRRELCTYLKSSNSNDHVYQLSVSLFPCTQEVERSK